MGRSQAITGGLLTGLGEGILLKAENRREDLATEQEAARERARELRRELMREGEFAERREHERGLLSNVITGEGGDVHGITRGGDVTDLGFKARPTAGAASASGMSAGDKRILDTAKDIYTTTDLSGEKTDWTKVATHLRKRGHEDLAQLVDPEKGPTTTDVNSDEYLEAQRMAEEWASDQAGFFSSDKSDFSDYGGNKTEAIQAKTREFYAQLTGTSQPSGGTNLVAPGSKPPESKTKPAGSGTKTSPYKPTTQEEFDQIKAGEYFVDPSDGQLYTK